MTSPGRSVPVATSFPVRGVDDALVRMRIAVLHHRRRSAAFLIDDVRGARGAHVGGGKPAADALEVLFLRAQDERVDLMTVAALGVNAYINHDLALALIATWERLGFPGDGSQHHDYLLINKIFFKEIPVLRRRFATAWQLEIDRFVGDLDWIRSSGATVLPIPGHLPVRAGRSH
jgi:hypothetical protein